MTLSDEDEKLVTLARGARARAGVAEGAAVRDQDGRTYAAATVTLPSFSVTAVQAAVAVALASAADELEAVVVVSAAGEVDLASVAAARDLAAPVLHLVSPAGDLVATVTP
jgi:cytidine deaminase